MLGKLKQKKSNNEGFTIIEVMIVLAIAGLILLIVFLAVPALQRNSRNTQRKNDAGRIASLIGEYESNNSGQAPSAFGTGAGALDLSSESFSIVTPPSNVVAFSTATTAAADTIVVMKNATCSNNKQTTATSTRSIVVLYGLEGATNMGCITAGS